MSSSENKATQQHNEDCDLSTSHTKVCAARCDAKDLSNLVERCSSYENVSTLGVSKRNREILSDWRKKLPEYNWHNHIKKDVVPVEGLQEIVNELRDSETISKKSINQLKNGDVCNINPVYVMDLRHAEVKKASLEKLKSKYATDDKSVIVAAKRLILEEELSNVSKEKEQLTVAREIDKFRMTLQVSKQMENVLLPRSCENKVNPYLLTYKACRTRDVDDRTKDLCEDTLFTNTIARKDEFNMIPTSDAFKRDFETFCKEFKELSANCENGDKLQESNLLAKWETNTDPSHVNVVLEVAELPSVQSEEKSVHSGESDDIVHLNQNEKERILREYFQRWKTVITHEASDKSDDRCSPEEHFILWCSWKKWRKYVYSKKRTRVKCELEMKLNILEKKHLKIENFYRKKLLRRYWKIWRNLVTINRRQRLLMDEKTVRKEKIDSFLKALEEYKKEIEKDKQDHETNECGIRGRESHSAELLFKYEKSAVEKKPVVRKALSGPRYEHRFQMQKQIIEQQKAKLKEQSKLIEELTISKLASEAELCRKETCLALAEKLPSYGPVLKKKVQQLAARNSKNITNVVEGKSDVCLSDSVNVQMIPPPPLFLKRMEERAAERARRKQLMLERKLKQEQEKQQQLQREKEEKERQLEEEKRKRIEEAKERKRREKELQEEKERERIRFMQLCKRANQHYSEHLLSRYGIRPLKQVVKLRIDSEEKADVHFVTKLLRHSLASWKDYVRIVIQEKITKAVNFYNSYMLRKYFMLWIQFHEDWNRNLQVAEDLFDLRLQERVFQAWYKHTTHAYLQRMEKFEKAINHYERLMLSKCFLSWKRLPVIMHSEREKQRRKDVWRQKVQAVLPDFKPIIMSE